MDLIARYVVYFLWENNSIINWEEIRFHALLTGTFRKMRRKTRADSTSLLNGQRRRMTQRIASRGSKFPLVKVTHDIGTSLAKTTDKRRHVHSPAVLLSTKSSWYLASLRFPPANYKLPENLQDSVDLRRLCPFLLYLFLLLFIFFCLFVL